MAQQHRAGSGGQKVAVSSAAKAVPLSQHTMGAQPSERSWKDAQSLARSQCPPGEMLCQAQGSVGGEAQIPHQGPNSELGMSDSLPSFPSLGAA